MRKSISSLIIFCIIILGLIFSGCNTKSVDQVKNEKISNINEISIDVSSTDVNIIPEEREDVKVHLHGERKGNLKKELLVNLDDNILKIKIKTKSGIIVMGSGNLELDVYIPKNYKENLKIDGSSSDVNIEDMHLNNLIIDLSSGDTDIKEMDLNKLTIDVSSGNTKMEQLDIKNFEYEASSGDLKGKNIKVESLQYETSSGKVKLESFEGNIEGKSTSGDIILGYEKFNNDINLRASSGNITIDLPNDAEFYFHGKVSSGDIDYYEFPLRVESKNKDKEIKGIVVSDENSIKIKTTSGDINVK